MPEALSSLSSRQPRLVRQYGWFQPSAADAATTFIFLGWPVVDKQVAGRERGGEGLAGVQRQEPGHALGARRVRRSGQGGVRQSNRLLSSATWRHGWLA